jgi:hypothetical protein
MIVRASAVLTAMIASERCAMSASPATRAADSGGSPADRGARMGGHRVEALHVRDAPRACATGRAATPLIQWCDWIRS